MTSNRIRVILERVLNNCSSEAEEAELLAFIEDESFRGEITPFIRQIWDETLSEEILSPLEMEGMAHRIFNLSAVQKDKPRKMKTILRNVYTSWFKYAAVLVVLLYVGLSLKRYFKLERKTEISNEISLPSGVIKPGKNSARLTLADGSTINLDSVNAGLLQSESGIAIIKSAQGELLYKSVDRTSKSVELNIISTPRGGQYNVLLSDGTKVWLNAESSLTYPLTFSGRERVVTLTGEGYFEVSKNFEKPFKVAVGGIQVLVLGTHFNIRANGNDVPVKTTLLEGSVKITNGEKTAMLTPGEQGEWESKLGNFLVGPANIEQAVAWKDGYFIFEGTELSSIMTDLGRWYDFDFELDSGVSNKRFSATILRTTSITQVLGMLEMTKEVRFKVKGRKIEALN